MFAVPQKKLNWQFFDLAIYVTFTESLNLNHRQYFCLYGSKADFRIHGDKSTKLFF